MNDIEQINETTFHQTVRGHDMTLTFEDGRWVMYTVNAVVRAYNRGFATPKFFPSLEAVEEQYKNWRGIAALVG